MEHLEGDSGTGRIDGASLEKIASRNVMRAMREAEAYAALHSGDPPIETKMPA